MNLDAITVELLRHSLVAWQRAQDPPPDILQLDLLRQFGSTSAAEQSLRLQDQLRHWVESQLTQQRTLTGIPPRSKTLPMRQEIETVLAQDFAHQNMELETWSAIYHQYFSLIELSEAELADILPVSPRNYRRRIQAGLERLTHLLRRAEWDAHQRYHAQHLRRHLPPPDYLELFGVEIHVKHLIDLLADQTAAPFISLEGLGGIGKTALARAVAHRLADLNTWQDILWISARQQWMTDQGEISALPQPARTLEDVVNRLADQLGQTHLAGLAATEKVNRLRPFLTTMPHLIIIDNLETLADVTSLLPLLRPLAGPTRFLLTSRQTMLQFPYVQTLTVPELTAADSAALIQSELHRRGANLTLDDAAKQQLYTLLGGIPLALKLTAAQLSRWPLTDVLHYLQAAGVKASALYTYIYRQTWEMLDTPARLLLLSALDITPDGESADWLRRISGLSAHEFDGALNQLLDFSLIEVSGVLVNRVYRLHRLTITFLRTDILGEWVAE